MRLKSTETMMKSIPYIIDTDFMLSGRYGYSAVGNINEIASNLLLLNILLFLRMRIDVKNEYCRGEQRNMVLKMHT